MVNPLDLNVLEFNSYPNRKYPKVWTLPTNMLREVVVSVVPKSTKHKDVAEKAQGLVDDFRSRISLRDFVETRLSHPAVESGEQKAFIDGQNVLIDRNRNNHSFPKLFEECRLAKAQQIVTRWKKEGRIPQDANIDFQREFCWPGCVIPAWLLAYVACDVSGERMRKGDDVDFIHARLALPYCDYFFTDRRMKHLLSVKPPGAPSALKDLKSMCRATIMDDPNEILGTLRPLV
jgi:hypothetical protein